MQEFEIAVYQEICRQQMIRKGSHVIAGVSGGADSVCLLLVLAALRSHLDFSLTVVHAEHGLRGEESLADAAFVEDLCRRQSIPCISAHLNVPAERKEGMTEEETGRILRYRLFENVRKEKKADYIAVAHNAGDQAETVLMNLARGSALRGAGGIRPVNGYLIRPLLTFTRTQIENYLKQKGQSWRTDRTNLVPEYTRNRVRLQVIPALEQGVNSKAVLHICETARRLQEAEDYIRKESSIWTERCVRRDEKDPGRILVKVKELAQADPLLQSYVFRDAFSMLTDGHSLKDVGLVHVQILRELAGKPCGSHADLPAGIIAWRERDVLCLSCSRSDERRRKLFPYSGEADSGTGLTETKKEKLTGKLANETERAGSGNPGEYADKGEAERAGSGNPGEYADEGETERAGSENPGEYADKGEAERAGSGNPGEYADKGEGKELRVELGKDGIYRFGKRQIQIHFCNCGDDTAAAVPQKRYTKWLAYDTITPYICLRTRRKGDYLVINSTGGRKKLKEYLIDEKVPREQRDHLLLAAQGSHVLWVVGKRISEAAKITSAVSRYIEISVNGLSDTDE